MSKVERKKNNSPIRERACDACGGTGIQKDDGDLGKAMSTLRKAKKMKARELAKKLGISASFLNDLENGRRRWGIKWETKVAEALR